MKDRQMKVSVEESTYRSTLETFNYEIAKNLRQIEEWRELANAQYAEAANCQRLIKDADRRIASLKQRRLEVEEQEEQFRESQRQDGETDYDED